MYVMSRYEKETVINSNDGDSRATVSTAQNGMKRRIKALAEEYPDDVKITGEDEYTLFAEFPKKWVKIRPPRFVSDEQRKKASERLKAYRESKNKDNDNGIRECNDGFEKGNPAD